MKPSLYHISLTLPAYLRVDLPDSSHVYTLGRVFKIANTGLLSTAEDYPFYEHIPVTSPYTNQLAISPEGVVTELISGVWTPIGQLAAVLFEHPEFLDDLGNGYFSETLASGAPLVGTPGGLGLFADIKAYYQTIFDIQIFYPRVVMKVDIRDCKAVLQLARDVSANMKLNILLFPNPNPPLAVIDAKSDLLAGYISDVDNGNHMMIAMRDETADELYHLLQQETIYVNEVGNGNRGILSQSGFPVIDEPSPIPVPEQVEIKRIEQGPHPASIKIYIHHLGMNKLLFTVQATKTPNDETSWKAIFTTTNSNHFLITKRIKGEEWWYRISASNTHGAGLWSNPLSFISMR